MNTDKWTEYQVESRFNPERCPGACHDWSAEGSPRCSLPLAVDRKRDWAARAEHKDFRVVRKNCAVVP